MVIRPADNNQLPRRSLDKIWFKDDSELISCYTDVGAKDLLVTLLNPDASSPVFAIYLEKGKNGIILSLVLKDSAKIEPKINSPFTMSDGSVASIPAAHVKNKYVPINTHHNLFLNEKMGVHPASAHDAHCLLDQEENPARIDEVLATLKDTSLLSTSADVRNELCERITHIIFTPLPTRRLPTSSKQITR